jgi:hypothetical protein
MHIPPSFPRIKPDTAEFEVDFREGSTYVKIRSGAEPDVVLMGGEEDPAFQAWIDRQIEKLGVRAAINRGEAVQLTEVRGRGQPHQWTAILEPNQVGISTPQLETVTTPGG